MQFSNANQLNIYNVQRTQRRFLVFQLILTIIVLITLLQKLNVIILVPNCQNAEKRIFMSIPINEQRAFGSVTTLVALHRCPFISAVFFFFFFLSG